MLEPISHILCHFGDKHHCAWKCHIHENLRIQSKDLLKLQCIKCKNRDQQTLVFMKNSPNRDWVRGFSVRKVYFGSYRPDEDGRLAVRDLVMNDWKLFSSKIMTYLYTVGVHWWYFFVEIHDATFSCTNFKNIFHYLIYSSRYPAWSSNNISLCCPSVCYAGLCRKR